MELRILINLAPLAVGVCLSAVVFAQALPQQPIVTPNGIGSAPMGANPDVPGVVTPPGTPPAPRTQIIPAAPVQPVAPPPASRTENLPMRFDAGAAVYGFPRHPMPLLVSPARCVATGAPPRGVVTPRQREQNAASFQEAA